MARYWNEMNYPQPTEEELKENAKNTRKKAASKGQTLHPIVIKSRQIANSWWGKAWCQNLERYADFDTRLPRGRRYVRTGAVIDLQIKKGKIQARVQGTRKTPYKVEIRISPLSERRIEEITGKCETRVETLDQLVNGDFPKELKDVFLEDGGLFPEPREISFSCSCPDWAVMCKHVAASLYGVGARLDEEPLLFFSLRGVDTNKLVDVVISSRVESMLANVDKPSDRIIRDTRLEDLFGVL